MVTAPTNPRIHRINFRFGNSRGIDVIAAGPTVSPLPPAPVLGNAVAMTASSGLHRGG